jgi:anti-sigma factor RsiW
MNQRDLELLSSYLDGQLKPSDSARLESRLSSDPNLRAVMDDLREARSLLRRLPSRKAPRNFTLTRKMVGQNPPMPRAYPAFRFVTTLATLLLFFTVGLNFLAPQLASQAPAYGMGGGGGGDTETFAAQAPATEAPAATEAPLAPSAEMVPLPTATLLAEDSGRIAETPAEKNGVSEEPAAPAEAQNAVPYVPPVWQIILAGIVVTGALLMLLMRQSAINRWRQRQ